MYRPDLFTGQTIIVSGAGSGLGKAIAFLFARLGANLAICGRDAEKLAHVVPDLESLAPASSVEVSPSATPIKSTNSSKTSGIILVVSM